MQLTKTGYYADFVVYPSLVLALGWAGLRRAPSIERWEWMLACAAGVIVWTLLEYLLHRHVLHRLPPFQRLHDLHHARSTHLIGTPTWVSLCLFAVLALSLWHEIEAVLASGLTVGLMLGYLWYVAVHHAVHHVKAQRGSWLHRAKQRHALHHHFRHPCNFGVTSGLWDICFWFNPAIGSGLM